MVKKIEITINFAGFDIFGNPITQEERDQVNRNYIETFGAEKDGDNKDE